MPMPTSDGAPSLQLGQRICQPSQQRQKAAGLSGATDGGLPAAVCDQDQGAERELRPPGLKGRTVERHASPLSLVPQKAKLDPRSSALQEYQAALLAGSSEVSGTSSETMELFLSARGSAGCEGGAWRDGCLCDNGQLFHECLPRSPPHAREWGLIRAF